MLGGLLHVALLILPAAARIRQSDRDALYRLYELTGGAHWQQNTNWEPEGDPCVRSHRWAGVGCIDPCDRWRDGETCDFGRVTALNLDGNNLTGSLTLWTEVGELTNLSIVDMSFNALSGSLPTELGRINNLAFLSVARNSLEGPIPTELGEINQPDVVENLRDLDLSRNRIAGPLPTELAVHTQLNYLDARDNSLEGALPTELAHLTDLQVLHLEDNAGLGGTLPAALGQVSRLRYLYASHTSVSGTVPPSIGALRLLQTLHLEAAALSGSLPAELCELDQLRSLKLADNRLVGPAPLPSHSFTAAPSQLCPRTSSSPAHLSTSRLTTCAWAGRQPARAYRQAAQSQPARHIQ